MFSLLRDKVIASQSIEIKSNWRTSGKLQVTNEKKLSVDFSLVDGSHFSYFSRDFQGGNRKLLA